MSDAEGSAPRRSQRERKIVEKYGSQDAKRKRDDTDTEGEIAGGVSGPEEEQEEEQDDGEEERAPKPKRKSAAAPGRKGKAKAGTGPPPTKKHRVAKATGTKETKGPTRRGRKAGVNGVFDADKLAEETKISADNSLFNAILNPSAALQSTVEDFLESLSQSPALAQAELINCIFRACGCNDSVDSDQVMDYDGVVDALDDFTEGLKKDDTHVYPLTSRLPIFKRFRASLSEFIDRLVTSAAELRLLYTTDLMSTLQTWVIAMSSSQLRSFRHTATVIALEMETALCDVAAKVEKEAEVVGRQKEGERKRKAAGSKGGREKELDAKAKEIRERRSRVAEFLKEFVDGVFVHRYRDLDPTIRAECVRAMGQWFKKYPSHFLDGSYLRYVGWVLSDTTTAVRLEAVRALVGAYENADYIGSMHHFTDRFKPRLVEMATGDTELAVRVAVVQVLQAIDGHALLEDEQREELCLLVYDEEAKVRKAVSGFVGGVWREAVEERLVGRSKVSQGERDKAGIKALAALLVKWGRALDKRAHGSGREEDEDGERSVNSGEGGSKTPRLKEIASLLSAQQKGRTALAVEALWDEIDSVRDWETLLDVLLLDHSATEARPPDSRGRRNKGSEGLEETVVDETWRLEEVEEGVLLEVLVAAIRKTKADAIGSKKGEEEIVVSDITRALIKALPRLFVKHQTDEKRIGEVLIIPQLMNLDMYLEMRMIAAYSSLWDDVTKQFLSHSSPTVLSPAVATIRHLLDGTSLSNTNNTKVLELEDELSSSLREIVGGREELEVASFSEDEVLSLAATCSRLASFAGMRNMTAWMEEDESGKQSSAWDIINALVDRGRLGYKEEEAMIEQAIQILTLHIVWKAKGLTAASEPSDEELRYRESVREQRNSLLEKLLEYAVGTQSNTMEGVKRAAFQNLMNLHILFCPVQTVAPDGTALPTASLSLSLDDEAQYRCTGFVQAEIERYSEEVIGSAPFGDEQGDAEDSEPSDDEDKDEPNKGKAKPGKSNKNGRQEPRPTSRSQLEREYLFIGVITTFLRAIRTGAIHAHHSSVMLAHYGRLGPSFDVCCKVIVDIVREEGLFNGNGQLIVDIVTRAIQESFSLLLDGVDHNADHSVALAKLLSSCFVMRGAQLAIVRRLDIQFVIDVHLSCLTWIGKRLAAYENNGNKKGRNMALLFFKVLTPLLSPMDSRNALRIKAHMEQILAQAKVQPSPTAKPWEPHRLYEKRLGTSASKDKASGKPRRKKAGKSNELVSTDDEEHEVEGLVEETNTVDARPRPRPRRVTRATGAELSAQESELSEPASENEDPDVHTPKARSKRKPETEPLAEESRDFHSPELPHLTNGHTTPKQSRKRGRSEDAGELSSGLSSALESEDGRDLSAPSQPVIEGEIQIKRKRVRH
ncbi:hypothetical protein GLOTRDRAFT_140817 [Gloeophyllum trabeum ATCC 11539]|uniref:SCD domain-containing protein n=1 Tax=Gloeophyllum trabeum (strain ATCC 11539 / FP-39264 / Madison 617) TaxID=670483 RepID=S7RCC1_GLOTA|nr:uncharacterized protein GLOTRDRAFT_140817 [Gloeophyllum trabeum ATCC 11539]EPQ51870.1 hypothetical protein GLOTRDRAFT_140817 [Gloeophyllum trabeum ATCC 11539]